MVEALSHQKATDPPYIWFVFISGEESVLKRKGCIEECKAYFQTPLRKENSVGQYSNMGNGERNGER